MNEKEKAVLEQIIANVQELPYDLQMLALGYVRCMADMMSKKAGA